MIKAAFLISFAGHCIFLSASGLNLRLPRHEKQPEDLAVELEIERPTLLPKIETIGEKKKLKEIEEIQKEPEPEHELQRQEVMLRYQDIIKQKIEEARRYPLWAKKQGIEGVVYLSFAVLSNGSCQDIKIIHSSGSATLDNEAVETIKRASLFPPIPKGINSPSIHIEVSIVFKLYK